MFYCEPCRQKRQWPESMSQSRGTCECCDVYAVCYDAPSAILADWGPIAEALGHPEVFKPS